MSLCTDTPVVVLNAHYTGLGIARNLGPLGVRVLGLTAHPEFPGNHSRWLEYRRSPDSLAAPDELCANLLELGRELGRRAVLFPTRDHDIDVANRFRTELDEHFILPFPDAVNLDRVLNKERLSDAADRAGVRMPGGVTLREPDDLRHARELHFPVMCKPVYASQWRKPGIWEAVGRNKVAKFDTFAELADFHARVCVIDPHMTVQEWIPGGERSLLIFGSYCRRGGEPTAFFTARKCLQYPALMGTGIMVEALPLPEIEAPARALLNAVQFHGVSEIEFKQDERTGALYLIEINARHWDQHRLGVIAGVNLSEAAYRDATGQPMRPMYQHEDPAMWIAERDLFRYTVRAFFGRDALPDLRAGCRVRRTFGVLDVRDMRPFLAMLGLLRTPRTSGPVRAAPAHQKGAQRVAR